MNRNRAVWRRLVAIEGIDGAGTTTLSRNLVRYFAEQHIPFESGCEPTDGPIGRLIRQGLSGALPMTRETLALLFAADRREHLYSAGGIQDALDEERIYLTDRYWFSSLAYQSLDCAWDWVDALNADYPLPGHLLYLGLPVDDAMKRISGRGERDIFETESQQLRVSDSYRKAIDTYRETGMEVLELDSRRPAEAILQDALAFLAPLTRK